MGDPIRGWEWNFHYGKKKPVAANHQCMCIVSWKKGYASLAALQLEDGRLVWDDGERKLRDILTFFDRSSVGFPRNTYNLVIIFLFFNNFFAFCSLCDIFPKERDQYMCLFTRDSDGLHLDHNVHYFFPKSSQHLPTPLFLTMLGHIPLSHLFFFITFERQQIFTLSFHLSLKMKINDIKDLPQVRVVHIYALFGSNVHSWCWCYPGWR